MNAGNSTALLQASHNYRERGMNTMVIIPAVDDRYGEGKVTCTIGLQAAAVIISRDGNLFEAGWVSNIDTLVQFMTESDHCI